MYVDDLHGCCRLKDVQREVEMARVIIEDLLGEGKAVNDEKTKTGQVIVIIGWEFNLLTQKVSVARKNLMKAMLCVFSVDLEELVTLKEVQRLASYLERYSVICRILRPFLSCLNRMMQQAWGLRRKIPFTEEVKTEIRMWRGWLYLLSVDSKSYARPFHTFRPRRPEFSITTDGSLGQVGIIVYKITDAGEACVGCSAVSINQFGFGDDSSYQNTCEYIGMVLGILALVKIGARNVDVIVKGDSTSSLSWIQKQKVSGQAAMNAALVLGSLCVRFGLEVNYTDFIKGIDNHKADRLSRIVEKRMTIERAMELNGHKGCPIIDLLDSKASRTMVEMCNPARGMESEREFQGVWASIREAIEGV
jgi:hypothetical protein